jgi:hypothetical protein
MKKLIVLGIILACVALTYMFPYTMINPGKLTVGHQDLNKKCLSCHEPFGGISNSKCISCHPLASIGKDSLRAYDNKTTLPKLLFHQGLANQECTSCHTDHKGLDPAMSLSHFNHDALSTAVIGNCAGCHNKPVDTLHQQLSASCTSCHTTKEWKLSGSFNHDMIQGTIKNNCASCHQKPNDSFHPVSNSNCTSCHSTSKWIPSTLNHTAYFQLDKNHTTACLTCHTTQNYKIYTCYGCHEHSEANILQKHQEEGISNISNCVSCHRSGSEHTININGNRNNENDSKEIKNVRGYNKEEEDD